MNHIPRSRRIFELTAAVLTGIGKLVLIDVLDQKLLFIVLVSLFWMGYVGHRWRSEPGILAYWGFTKKSFWATFYLLLPYAALGGLCFYLYGSYTGKGIIHWHIIPVFLFYPIWGTIQQFLVVGLVAGNLTDLEDSRLTKPWIVMITAILFSIVHYPSLLLIVGTFVLAIVYTIVYIRNRNLWVLGLYHGWLGCLFYFFALGRDPWLEVFG